MHSSADISPCGKFRYRLDRWWSTSTNGAGRVGFLMLNPSTADAREDDATIRKCTGFAFRWGFMGFTVVNLYALRSRFPDELVRQSKAGIDILGARNLEIIEAVATDVEGMICAWGCSDVTRCLADHREHVEHLVKIIRGKRIYDPQQLGPITKSGTPRHPLMAPYASERIPFYGY